MLLMKSNSLVTIILEKLENYSRELDRLYYGF